MTPILAMVGAHNTTIPGRQDNRDGFTTPEPVYVDPPRPITLDQRRGRDMTAHERARVRAAALHAKRVYPGAVGDLIARELLSWEEFGCRLGSHSMIMQAVHDILATPTHPAA